MHEFTRFPFKIDKMVENNENCSKLLCFMQLDDRNEKHSTIMILKTMGNIALSN